MDRFPGVKAEPGGPLEVRRLFWLKGRILSSFLGGMREAAIRRKRGQLWARETDTVKKEPLSSYAPNPTHDQYLTLGLGLGGVGNR